MAHVNRSNDWIINDKWAGNYLTNVQPNWYIKLNIKCKRQLWQHIERSVNAVYCMWRYLACAVHYRILLTKFKSINNHTLLSISLRCIWLKYVYIYSEQILVSSVNNVAVRRLHASVGPCWLGNLGLIRQSARSHKQTLCVMVLMCTCFERCEAALCSASIYF